MKPHTESGDGVALGDTLPSSFWSPFQVPCLQSIPGPFEKPPVQLAVKELPSAVGSPRPIGKSGRLMVGYFNVRFSSTEKGQWGGGGVLRSESLRGGRELNEKKLL